MKVKKRRKRRVTSKKRRVRRNPSVKRRTYRMKRTAPKRRRRKRNPGMLAGFDIQSLAVNGAIGIAGAIANTFAANFIGKFVFKTGATPVQMNMVRLLSALGLSFAAYKSGALKKDNAEALAIGMLVAVGLPVVNQAFGLAGYNLGYDRTFLGASSVSSIMSNMGLNGLIENRSLDGLMENQLSGGDDYNDVSEFM